MLRLIGAWTRERFNTVLRLARNRTFQMSPLSSVMIIAQFSDQIEDVTISCQEDLTVETRQVNTELKWDFRVQTEVRPDPSPRSSRRDALSYLPTFPVFSTLNHWN